MSLKRKVFLYPFVILIPLYTFPYTLSEENLRRVSEEFAGGRDIAAPVALTENIVFVSIQRSETPRKAIIPFSEEAYYAEDEEGEA